MEISLDSVQHVWCTTAESCTVGDGIAIGVTGIRARVDGEAGPPAGALWPLLPDERVTSSTPG